MNLLSLIVDGPRPQFARFGAKNMVMPHIDKLAASAVVFRGNYRRQAVCSPSRTSLPPDAASRPETRGSGALPKARGLNRR